MPSSAQKSKEKAVEVITYLRNLRGAVVEYAQMFEQRLSMYHDAQQKGENPVLRIPREKGGTEPAVSQSELARIQEALNIKFPSVDKEQILDGDFSLEHEGSVKRVKGVLERLIEVVTELKIRHKVPNAARELFGEEMFQPPLKHFDIGLS